jgi:hypothetical protein
MNKSLVTAGIPGGKYDLDVDAYEAEKYPKLRHVIEYVVQEFVFIRAGHHIGKNDVQSRTGHRFRIRDQVWRW